MQNTRSGNVSRIGEPYLIIVIGSVRARGRRYPRLIQLCWHVGATLLRCWDFPEEAVILTLVGSCNCVDTAHNEKVTPEEKSNIWRLRFEAVSFEGTRVDSLRIGVLL